MTRRLAALLVVVLGFQALVIAPAAIAGGCVVAMAAETEDDCHGSAGRADESCPCCPAGVDMAGCVSACAGLAMLPIAAIDLTSLPGAASQPFVPVAIHSQAYTPPDPPPIR